MNTPIRTDGVITDKELHAKNYPPITEIVEGLLTSGLHVVAAPPKSHKTYFALDLAYSIASGTDFLGRATTGGPVLFYSLENHDRSVSERTHVLSRSFPHEREEVGLKFNAPLLGQGFEDEIHMHLERGVRLLVIDTLVRALTHNDKGSQYEVDARRLAQLSKLVAQYPNQAVLFVSHTRESRAKDVLDSVYGSRGLTGTIDCGLILERYLDLDPTGQLPTHLLRLRARDIKEPDPISIRFDESSYRMLAHGQATVVDGNLRSLIIEVLEENAGQPMKAVEIAREIGGNAGSVRVTLGRMMAVGLVNKNQREYTLNKAQLSQPAVPPSAGTLQLAA